MASGDIEPETVDDDDEAEDKRKKPLTKHDDVLAELFDRPAPVGLRGRAFYVFGADRWFWWTKVRWERDDHERVQHEMHELALSWLKDKGYDSAKAKIIFHLLDNSKKESVLESLRRRDGMFHDEDDLDPHPELLGCRNGVLKLDELDEKTRLPRFIANPDPDWLITRSTRVKWDPEAECPRFVQFVREIMGDNDELIDYLLRTLGYALFGWQREQKFWVWVGQGNNGKGTLAKVIQHVLGEYAGKPNDDLYMKSRNPAKSSDAREDLVSLRGLRFTWMSEPHGGAFNDELLKAHTGDDPITARAMYKKQVTFRPTHKVIFLTNNPPRTEDVGASMRRRVRLIWFEQDFSGPRMNQGLEDELKAEAPGILKLLATAAYAWRVDGLAEPAKVTEWSTAYIEENDPLGQFLHDQCVVERVAKVSAKLLHAEYEDWARKAGYEPMTATGFGLAMGRRFNKVKTNTGAVYHGVRVKSAMEVAEDDD